MWATTTGTRVHFGTKPEDPDVTLQTSAECCGYHPDGAPADAEGQVVVVWYSNATRASGLYAQAIAAAGPAGPKLAVPESATPDRSKALGIDQRAAVARRVGGGVYVAYGSGYPTFTAVKLWRFGAERPALSIPAAGAQDVNLAAAPGGRLWLVWHRQGRIHVARTNAAATAIERQTSLAPPRGTTAIWKLSAEGSLSAQRLDVLAAVSLRSALATWHTQVRLR
jgi:hypothetical protein